MFFRALSMPQGLLNTAIGHIIVQPALRRPDHECAAGDVRLQHARSRPRSRRLALPGVPRHHLPLIRPSIIGAALLAAALSLDEFVVTWFNIGNQRDRAGAGRGGLMRRGVDPSINAIATILLTLLVCLVIGSNILNRKKV